LFYDFFRNELSDLGYYKQTSDIDLAKKPVVAISVFAGNFNGQNFSIKGLAADGKSRADAWILMNTGLIENLKLEKSMFFAPAILAGINYGIIRNSYISGELTNGDVSSTGVVASINRGIIENVTVDALIKGISNVGGIVGENYSSGELNHVFFNGSVQGGGKFVGGVVGNNNGKIFDVHVIGSVEMQPGTGLGAGGLVGFNNGGNIDASTVNGKIYSDIKAGGLVGISSGGSLLRSKFSGTVSARSGAGGIVAAFVIQNPSDFRDLYVTGHVYSDDSSKTIGQNCWNCFFTGTIDLKPVIEVFRGSIVDSPSVEQFKNSMYYFDFNSNWILDRDTLEKNSHPILNLEVNKLLPVNSNRIRVDFVLSGSGLSPKKLIFQNLKTKKSFISPFVYVDESVGPYDTSASDYATIFLEPGEYKYAAARNNDGFIDKDFCELRETYDHSSGRPESPLRDLTILNQPISIRLGRNCPFYGNNPASYRPTGNLLSEPETGTVLFFDDFEDTISNWTELGFEKLWTQIESSKCAPALSEGGKKVLLFGSSSCKYNDYSYQGETYFDSKFITGISQNSKISFDVFWDLGPNNDVSLELSPGGGEIYSTVIWYKKKSDSIERKWTHIEAEIPYLPYLPSNGGLMKLRIKTHKSLQSGKESFIGVMFDNIKVLK
jgi:hypothetical protein